MNFIFPIQKVLIRQKKEGDRREIQRYGIRETKGGNI
jgi:hypothetical protein